MAGEVTVLGAAAVFGRVVATLMAVFANIIALILIIMGVIHLRAPQTRQTTSVVIQVDSCVQNKTADSISCVATVAYAVGGVQYTGRVTVRGKIAVGAVLPLLYNPQNPQDIVADEGEGPWAGWLMIGSGALLAGVATGIAVLTYKSKAFAAGYGAVEGLGMVLAT